MIAGSGLYKFKGGAITALELWDAEVRRALWLFALA